MAISFVSWVLLIFGLVITTWLYFWFKKNPLAERDAVWMSNDELGLFEERISNLAEVILVADKIEVPSNNNYQSILTALLDNFGQEVKYVFLVPEEYESEHGNEIRRRYQNIIQLARDLWNKKVDDDLFELKSRPFYSNDYPFLFYRYFNQNGENEIVAFRGEEEGKGIANYYRRLEPEVARSFLFSILPFIRTNYQQEIEKYDQFTKDPKVIALDPENQSLRKQAGNE